MLGFLAHNVFMRREVHAIPESCDEARIGGGE